MGVLGLFRRREVGAAAQGAAPAGLLEWQPAGKLLASADRQAVLRQIKEAVGVPAGHFHELYQGLTERFAEFVQLLPASENHHHAHAGGLLDHSLDVAQKAVSLRRGHLLPPGAEPEVVARESDRWTFAVFSAALLHDVGKAVLLGQVERFAADGASLGAWVGWAGAMPGATRYRLRYTADRRYQDYPLVGPFLARALVPDLAIAWIGADRALMTAWIAALAGDEERGGVISEIVGRADRLSVAASLGVEAEALPAAARRSPLHQRLAWALRELVDAGDLPINRRGAGGWVFGDELFVVAKRGIDAMRERLLAEGHTDIPSRNERIMDELQQHRVCVANGDRAVWTVRVRLSDFDQELTVLRFALSTLWPAEDRRPKPMAGSVAVVGEPEVDSAPAPSSAAGARASAPTFQSAPEPSPVSAAALVPATSPATAPAPEPAQMRAGAPVPYAPLTPPLEVACGTPAAVGRSTAAEEDPAAGGEPDGKQSGTAPADGGARPLPAEPESFIAWLAQAIASGRVNQPNAPLHVVPEGLLIVSPRAFKVYAADGEGREWEYIQRRFVRLRWHRFHPGGQGICEYEVRGERKRSRLKGLVLIDPERRLEVSLPPANPHLTRAGTPPAAAGRGGPDGRLPAAGGAAADATDQRV